MTTQVRASARGTEIGKGWLWIPWFVALAFALLSALIYFTNLRLKNDLLAIRTSARTQEADLQQSRAMLDMLKSSTSVRASMHGENEAKRPSGEVVYDPENGNLILMVSNVAPIPTEKVYQFWLFPEQGAAISAGTFRPDDRGNAAVVQWSLPSGLQLKAFGVSLEERGGAEVPTSAMILSASLRE